MSGQAIPVTTDTAQGRFGVRGLKFVAPTNFTDFLDTSTSPARVTNNLWAFWNGGSRGRSAMFYSSAVAGQGFEPYQALPLPAGLSSAANASAILVQAPDANGLPVPMIEVTYSGVGADGNADIYVSRYRPYFIRKADRTILTVKNTLGSTVNAVGLALVGGAALTEQLQPDTAHQYYQARDVAWARTTQASGLDVLVNGTSLLSGYTPAYDRASGQLIYTSVPGKPFTSPTFSGTTTITAVYVDLARGRVRFRTRVQAASPSTQVAYDVPLPDTVQVTATFQSQARRITTDSRADTEPIAFFDEAYKSNESPGLNRVATDRYWYIWRKAGAPGTSTTPTLYSKTQRLTIYLHDNNTPAQPVVLNLDNTGKPTGFNLTDMSATNAIPSADLLANVDVDWVRGRLYFPVSIDGISTEGHPITVAFTYRVGTGTNTYTMPPAAIRWMDELRYNDSVNQPASDTFSAANTTEHALLIDVATNESNVSAFLDPFAYADVPAGSYDPINGGLTHTDGSMTVRNSDQPHKVWLFWNSTRNGTADLYYETMDPRFSANP